MSEDNPTVGTKLDGVIQMLDDYVEAEKSDRNENTIIYAIEGLNHIRALEHSSWSALEIPRELLLKIRARSKFHKKDANFSSIEISSNDWYLLLDSLGINIAGAKLTSEPTNSMENVE